MDEMYFVFQVEDGINAYALTKKELLNALKDGTITPDYILNDMPCNWNMMKNNETLIIKGFVVVPEPVTTVLSYDID